MAKAIRAMNPPGLVFVHEMAQSDAFSYENSEDLSGEAKMSNILRRSIGTALWCLTALVCGLHASGALAAPGVVTLLRTPDAGIQPQAAVDDQGIVHLIYFKGDARGGDLYYVHSSVGQPTFSPPVRVNSEPGSAVAAGTIRGGQIAVGKGGRVYVVWNGSNRSAEGASMQHMKTEPESAVPFLYTRLNDSGTAFEPQRNLITWATGIDGGGAIAADRTGNVYALWHASAGAKDEAGRAIYIARSRDNGQTFEREVRASADPTGACSCCGMRAFVNDAGVLYALYRTAAGGVNRDSVLLVSRDRAATFEAFVLDLWKVNACPMSSYSLAAGKQGILAAWETKGQVLWTAIQPAAHSASSVAAPGTGSRKHPVVVGNSRGETLLAWAEGTGWQKGGSLAWQVYDAKGMSTDEKGQIAGIPAFSLATGYAQPDGGFVLIY